jgi:general secretion pathway protein K
MVQALIVLAGLVSFLAVLAADQRVTMQAMQNQLRSRRAELAARSAVQRALAALQAANSAVVTLNDTWATLGTNAATSGTSTTQVGTSATEAYDLGMAGNQGYAQGEATFRFQIVDNASLININSAPLGQLNQLPLTQQQLDSFQDWIQPGQNPRPTGAKDTYYNALPTPYNTKLAPLTTLNELLLIQGWTASTLFATQTNDIVSTAIPLQDSSGQPLPLIAVLTINSGSPSGTRINVNVPAAQLSTQTQQRLGITGNIARNAPFRTFQQILSQPGVNTTMARQILNLAKFSASTRDTGKININTASQAVLETIPGITQDLASAIVTQQQTGFQTLGALTTVSGINVPLLARIADYLTVSSDTFTVRAYGESGGYGVALEVTIRIQNGQVQVVDWERLPDTGIPTWWNWDQTPTTTVDAGAQS